MEPGVRKYGSPEPVAPVHDTTEPEADEQGINVTAAREDAARADFSPAEIVDEGSDRRE